MRIKAVVAYDGSSYSGFQHQAHTPTIQSELESTLERLTQDAVRVLASGRTDAGVHAEGQVIAFDTQWRHPLQDLQRGMNALLPDQIAVRELSIVEDGFHPRYAALRRHYRYTLYQAAVRHPLVNRYSLHVAHSLDVAAMRQASQSLVGEHDFLAFGTPPQGNNSVREVSRADWQQEFPWLYFDIEANAFLYRMVRMLVGTLLRVGRGVLAPGDFIDILCTQDRSGAGPAAPPQGLCLKSVVYPPGL